MLSSARIPSNTASSTHAPSPPAPPSPPPPPAPPAIYSFYRCFLQVKGKKYVRMYSQDYKLLTTGIEGTCTLQDSQYFCGKPDCRLGCDDISYGVV